MKPKKSINHILNLFPKKRIELSEKHKELYLDEYKINRSDRGPLYSLVSKLESWMHKTIASTSNNGSILELGAGSLNHLKFEKLPKVYDVVEDLPSLCYDSPYSKYVTNIYSGYSKISDLIGHAKYDRIISVAVLEHLDNLPLVLASSALLLDVGGQFQAGIPSEGGFVWGLSWRLTTGISYRIRTGLSYVPIMQHEHINDYFEVLAILEFLYQDVRVVFFPLNIFHLSFYCVIECHTPIIENCNFVLNYYS